jgi:hypothetical protein
VDYGFAADGRLENVSGRRWDLVMGRELELAKGILVRVNDFRNSFS